MTARPVLSRNAFTPDFTGASLRIGIVQGRFNESIGAAELSACRAELEHLGVRAECIMHCTVPGALEIPLVLQKLAQTGCFDALIALGAVIPLSIVAIVLSACFSTWCAMSSRLFMR